VSLTTWEDIKFDAVWFDILGSKEQERKKVAAGPRLYQAIGVSYCMFVNVKAKHDVAGFWHSRQKFVPLRKHNNRS